MLKNISQLEVMIKDKFYRLNCDIDSPLEHVKEALFQFQKYIGYIEDQIKANQAAKESEKSPNDSSASITDTDIESQETQIKG